MKTLTKIFALCFLRLSFYFWYFILYRDSIQASKLTKVRSHATFDVSFFFASFSRNGDFLIMTKKRGKKHHRNGKPIRRQLPFYIERKGKHTYAIIVSLPSGDSFGMLIKYCYFEKSEKHSFTGGVLNNKKRGSKRKTISGNISPGKSRIQPLLPKGFCEYHDIWQCK